MKRHIIPCILSLTLLLTACGGEQAAADTAEEAVKDHYYQILDAAGKELYTVTDSGAVAEIDALINKAGGENADHGNAEGDPLYTYVYWQETTLHAGEDPDAEREYLEVFRTQVRKCPGKRRTPCGTRRSLPGREQYKIDAAHPFQGAPHVCF